MDALMTPAPIYPPSTAYEILKGFFPAHNLHTVVKAVADAKGIALRCNCGNNALIIDTTMMSTLAWSLKDIRHALRNVM